MNSYYTIPLILALSIVMIQACSENSSGPDDGKTVEITGTVHAPDGRTPLSGATVFIPTNGVNKVSAAKKEVFTSPVEGTECQEPTENYSVFTCTNADGSFTFEVSTPAGRLH